MNKTTRLFAVHHCTSISNLENMIKSLGVVLPVALLLIGCQRAASQVRCFSGVRCRPENEQDRLTTPDGCCSSPNSQRSYTVPGSESCDVCSAITYGCFVAECSNVDLNAPDSENTTFAVNDGERVCCRSGQYRSWTDSGNQGTCNACPPVVETTTVNEQEPTTPTTLPEGTDSGSQNPDSDNVANPTSGSGRSHHSIAGTVITTITLAIATFIY